MRRPIPNSVLAQYGPPSETSGDWAVWRHNCGKEPGKYKSLLYSYTSGWLLCKACGYRRSPKSLGGKVETVAVQPPTPRGAQRQEQWDPVYPGYPNVYEYLTQVRGLTPEEVADYALVSPLMDAYAAFPLTEDGKVVSWHARYAGPVWDDEGPIKRYLSPGPESGWKSTGETLWGLDRIEAGRPVYICEGIFDAMYFPTGVAFMGGCGMGVAGGDAVGTTETQRIKVLDRDPSRVMLVLDNDSPGHARIRKRKRMWRQLKRWVDVNTLPPPPGYNDFGDLVAEGRRF